MGRGGGSSGGQGGLVGTTAARFHSKDRTEPGFADPTQRSPRDARLAPTELSASAVQQQEGAAGLAPRYGHSFHERRSDRDPSTTRVDRLQGHLQGDGLVNEPDRARAQRPTRKG